VRLITKIAHSSTLHSLDGGDTFLKAIAEGLLPDPSLPLDAWSDRYMVIPRSSGASEYGKYSTARTPHARHIMQSLSVRHPSRRVVLMAASQMLKTQVALNWFCYIVHQHPSNLLWLMPTGKLQKRIAQRIDKTVAAVDVITRRVAPPGSRLATNSQDIKMFDGGTLYIATAGSAANLAEVPARFVSFDEIDRAELSVDGEGDPVKLAEGRQTTHGEKAKSYYYSSPTIKGESRIERLYDEGTQRRALAECVHCGHAQELLFERLTVIEGKAAAYPCEACGALHYDHDKGRMFANGLWSDAVQESTTESYHISAMYQPHGWLTWYDLHAQYAEAHQDMEMRSLDDQMVVFYNTRLAKSWSRTKVVAQHKDLMSRALNYPMRTAPDGVLFVTAGVDTQDNRLAVQLVGWGIDCRAWVLDYIEFMGDPQEREVWDQLADYINHGVKSFYEQYLRVAVTAIDYGGHRGEAVKNFCRSKRIANAIPIRGSSNRTAPALSRGSKLDVTWKGAVDKRSVVAYQVGTNTLKDMIFAKLSGDAGREEHMIEFCAGLPDEYYHGVLSEVYDYKKKAYVPKPGIRNEPLDTLVYACVATYHATLRLHRKTEKEWSKAMPDYQDIAVTVNKQARTASDNGNMLEDKRARLREAARERRGRRGI
jgi:phage terminase large subunit GpA-like protein